MAKIIKICNSFKEMDKESETINDKIKPILSKKLQMKKEQVDRTLQKFIDHADSLDW